MAGRITIDPERVPELIRKLNIELEEAKKVQEQASYLGSMSPWSPDPVSQQTARKIGERGAGGSNALTDGADGLVKMITSMISNLERGLADFRQQETAGRTALSRGRHA